jgi:transposase-like protein
VIELARQPNTSVAAVALANGLNANMLRRWVREADVEVAAAGIEPQAAMLPAFVQLPTPETGSTQPMTPRPPSDVPSNIVVEIQRSGTTVRASLPLSAASAVWLREVLG